MMLKRPNLYSYLQFKLVDDWYKAASSNFREALILASTRNDIADLNLIARAKLADAG
jgi:hypothetical protein